MTEKQIKPTDTAPRGAGESAGLGSIPYITLWAHGFDATVAFYRDQLGLAVEHIEPNFAQFATQGTKLYVHRLEEATPLRSHSVEIHFAVADVDATHETLLARGAVFEQPPRDMPWGVRMAALRDPEGYGIEIIGPLAAGDQSDSK
jgi:catechol 2,3-dioxygenase-like lactoylglutathione lyase family enzyme